MTIKAIVHEGEDGGYWAEVPSMPGCFTQGDTMEELVSNLYEAVELWLEPDQTSAAALNALGVREVELQFTAKTAA